jgi:hypothetical protein
MRTICRRARVSDMYRTTISSFFTLGRRPKLNSVDIEMNGYRDEDTTSRMKDSLNDGRDFECRSTGPFYYFVGSLFREYRKMLSRLGR